MRRCLRAAGGVLALLAAFWCATVRAQDAPGGDVGAGRKVAQHVCQVCHGLNGIAKQPDAANLAGQDAGYLYRQLGAFHSGERKNEIMSVVAQTLSDQQMRDAATYYGAVKITVTSVPAP